MTLRAAVMAFGLLAGVLSACTGAQSARQTRQILNAVVHKLPSNDTLVSTIKDVELYDYLFLSLSPKEQAALQLDTVFAPEVNLDSPRTYDVYALGKRQRENRTSLIVCAVTQNTGHSFFLSQALYDQKGLYLDSKRIGKLDFAPEREAVLPAQQQRKYWVIFQKDALLFSAGNITQSVSEGNIYKLEF